MIHARAPHVRKSKTETSQIDLASGSCVRSENAAKIKVFRGSSDRARRLHYSSNVAITIMRIACAALVLLVVGAGERLSAEFDTGAESAAVRELFEGTKGQRESWAEAPELVVLTSVLDFALTDVSAGYVATTVELSRKDADQLVTDLSGSLVDMTGGRLTTFRSIRLESAEVGESVKVVRRGQIVAGRFHGVRTKAGTLGYGIRTVRQGAITAAAVMLDDEFDRGSEQRRSLRTHELGHALGYNHVESQPSVMNPRVGPGITAFDRRAIKQAVGLPTPQRSVRRAADFPN